MNDLPEAVYVLHVQSTGEEILREPATDLLYAWQRRTERKMSRRRNRAERFREAIQAQDTIAAWANYDDFVAAGLTLEELEVWCRHVFGKNKE